MEKTMVRQAVPLQPMEDDGEQRFHLQPVEDPTLEQVMAPNEAVTPWEAHAGAGSWQNLWPRGERSPHQSRFAGRTRDPMGDSCWSSLFLKDCTPWKGPTLEQSGPEGLHSMEGTHAGAVCS
ncbi:zinc finger and BTB domain-containing protein 5 [Grus japonensis]|uniref:Zinc finger and BTB domain-containing protein 5 n=1 Tax=Grus japonensis TaxID=30415 RepID=A0ABC9Y4M1_GRUJA